MRFNLVAVAHGHLDDFARHRCRHVSCRRAGVRRARAGGRRRRRQNRTATCAPSKCTMKRSPAYETAAGESASVEAGMHEVAAPLRVQLAGEVAGEMPRGGVASRIGGKRDDRRGRAAIATARSLHRFATVRVRRRAARRRIASTAPSGARLCGEDRFVERVQEARRGFAAAETLVARDPQAAAADWCERRRWRNLPERRASVRWRRADRCPTRSAWRASGRNSATRSLPVATPASTRIPGPSGGVQSAIVPVEGSMSLAGSSA